jgi:hypothetical protein
MKLGYMMLLVAVGTMLVIAPSAMAAKAEKGHGDKNVVMGKVTAVGTPANTITIAVQGKKDAPAAEPKVIATTKDTTVFAASKGADGKIEEKKVEGGVSAIEAGARVAVTIEGEKAVKIVVMPAREKK